MRFNILIGGQAGQGSNILADLVSKAMVSDGYYVFYSRDYQSLIRGGHNFNLISFSENPIMSNHEGADILCALDEDTKNIHRKDTRKSTIVLEGGHPNMYFAGCLFKLLGIEFKILDSLLKELGKRYEENIKEAEQGYAAESRSIKLPKIEEKQNLNFMNGSQAIAAAAIASGLDVYYAYPMTPATSVLTELAQAQLNKSNKHLAVQLESEIACINASIGSAIVGAKSMTGTSGGGFDLMTEAISLAGMAEVPVVIYLSQRPGPSTGVPTYQSQADLNVALYGGHGEFPRVVIAPGDPKEAASATSEAFYLSQKFRIPVILLGDKHLAESKFSFEGQPKIIKSEKSIASFERFNGYEKGSQQEATDNPEQIAKNARNRLKKQAGLKKEIEEVETCKIFGNPESKNLVVSWGSTKGAIFDAIQNKQLNCKFLQLLYIEPFPEKARQELSKAENIIVIENNASSPLSELIAEKTERIILDENQILKYDGRPFTCDEVSNKLSNLLHR